MMKTIFGRIFLIAALLCALCFGAFAEDSVYSIGYYTENNKSIAYTDVSGAMTSALYEEMIASVQSGSTLSTITVLEGGSLNAGSNTVSADVVNQGTISGGTYEYLINHGTMTSGTVNELHNYGTVTGGTYERINNYGTVTGGVVYSVFNYADGIFDGASYREDGDTYYKLTFAGPIYNYGEILGGYNVRSGAELVKNEGTTYVRVYGNRSWGYDDGGYCWDVDYSYYAMTGFQTVGEVLGQGWHAYGGEYAYDMELALDNTLYKQWTISNGVLIFKGCTSVSNVPEIPQSVLEGLDHIDATMGMVKFPTVNVPVYVKNTTCISGTYYDVTITGGTFNGGITFNETGKIESSTINCTVTMQKAGSLTGCIYGTDAKIRIVNALTHTSNRWGGFSYYQTYDCPVEITADGSIPDSDISYTFSSTVTNNGTIAHGTFNGRVNNYGTISGGVFNGGVYGSGTIDATVDVTRTSLAEGEIVEAYLYTGSRVLPISNATYQWWHAKTETADGTAIYGETGATLTNNLGKGGYVYPVVKVGSTSIEGPRVGLAHSGTCGDNATFQITGSQMTVSGKGAIYDYDSYTDTPWYHYKNNITSLTIGEGITRVGKCSFDSFNELTSLSLPESLKSIGGYGFYGLYYLTSVTLPSKLETLDYSAFSTCYALQSIVIPDSVTTMNETAFCNNTSLTSVTLSKNLKAIPTSAFNNTPMLKRVVIPQGVESIAHRAFSYGGLEHITIPYSVTSIASTAFEGREGAVTIACHADSAAAVFAETYGHPAEIEPHTEITLEAVAPTCTEPGLSEGVSCSVCGYAIIPQEELPATGHTEIVDEAVDPTCTETGLTEGSHCETCDVVLTEQSEIPALGHTEVVDEAVEPTCSETGLTEGVHCSVCNEVIIAQEVVDTLPHTEEIIPGYPATCTEPGIQDYIYCSVCYEDIQLDEEIPALGHSDSVSLEAVEPTCTEDGRTAEHSCSRCGEVITESEIVPAFGHTEIADEAVEPTCLDTGLTAGSHCETCGEVLTAQEIVPALGHTVVVTPGVPPTCTEPGLADGEHCSVCGETIAEQIEIPAAHTPVTDPAVEPTDYDTGLTEGSHCGVCGEVIVAQEVIPANFTWDGKTVTAYNGDKTHVVIPDGATALGNTLFKNNTTVVSVTVPDSVTSIGSQTFFGCSSMTDVYLPDTITTVASQQSFMNTTATVHASADSATAVALSRRNVAFTTPDGYTLLYKVLSGVAKEAYLVKYVGSETELTIPAAFGGAPLTQIQTAAFAGNTALTSVVIPDSVTVLGAGAFHGCGNLSSVTIPDGVTAIEATTFAACFSLRSIDLPDNLTSIGTYAFSACPLTSIDIPDSVTTIDEAAFINTSSLITAKLPANLTAIPNQLFSGSKQLRSITIPAKVTSIGDSAFFMCESITEMIVPEGVTAIGSNAFSGCTALSSLYLPGSLATLGNEVFSYLSSLSQIVLPDNITSVGTDLLKNTSATLYCNDGTTTAQTLSAAGYWYSPLLTIETMEKADGSVDVIVTDCPDFVTEVVIPEGVTKISDWALANCYQLKSVTLPSTLVSISEYAFYDCHALESIEIPDGVHTIGMAAFYNCSSLTSVTLPKRLITLGESAFMQCYALESVEIPDGLEVIPSNAFANCYDLSSVTIPDSVKTIGDCAFSGSDLLTAVTLPAGITEIGYGAFGNAAITLPELDCPTAHALGKYNVRYYVEGIPSMKFMVEIYESSESEIWLSKADSSITEAIVPEGVSKIQDNAFASCTQLTHVELPQSLYAICSGAFMECTALESIVIPDSVTSIWSDAFSNCTALKDVTLSSNLTEISTGLFVSCTSLESIVIPEGVTTIHENAFYACSTLKNVSIPGSVTTIATAAFSSTPELTSLSLPAGVETVIYYTFDLHTKLIVPAYDCATAFALSECGLSFALADDLSLYFQVTTNENGETVCAVTGCDPSAANVVVPEFATAIASYTSSSFSGLDSITLHGNITSIAHDSIDSNQYDVIVPSFDCTTAITLSNLGHRFTTAENTQFYYRTHKDENGQIVVTLVRSDTSITEAVVPEFVSVIDTYAFMDCSALTSVTLPEQVTTICDHAFFNCYELKEIHLGRGLTDVADGAFTGCTENLRRVIPETDCPSAFALSIAYPYFYYVDGTENLRLGARSSASSPYGTDDVMVVGMDTVVSDVVIPEGVTIIGSSAFAHQDIWTVTMPDSVTHIENDAFYNCYFLGDVTFSESLVSIGNSAFENCYINLTALDLPDSLETIGGYAFRGCTALETVTMGDNVKSIGDFAFDGCSLLAEIDLPGSIEFFGNDSFPNTAVYLPGFDCTSAYTMSDAGLSFMLRDYPGLCFRSFEDGSVHVTSWVGDYADVVVPEGVTHINDYAFLGNAAMTTITLPEGLTTIGDYAFASCNELTSLHIPSGVTEIGSYAFNSCRELTEITGLENVVVIGEFAFYECVALESIAFGSRLTEIGRYVFYNCDSLTEVELPENITSIAQYAFYECSNLKKVTLSGNMTSIDSSAFANCPTALIFMVPEFDCQTALLLGSIGHQYTTADYEQFRFLARTDENGAITISVVGSDKGITEVTLPECVTEIGTSAFSGRTNLLSVIIPENVTTLDLYAFSDCCNLESVVIGSNVTSIGFSAFYNCAENLVIKSPADAYARTYAEEYGIAWEHDLHVETIIPGIPATHLTEGVEDALYCEECGATYAGGAAIPKVTGFTWTLPASLTAIETEAFMQTPAVIVELPEGCERIGSRAFAESESLAVVLIPGTVTEIDASAFDGCTENLVILTDEGSAAQALAEQKDMLLVIR